MISTNKVVKLHILKSSKKRPWGYKRLVIGIAGTYKGAGATHLGLMLTACISEGLGRKTAYLHWQENKDISMLREYFYKKEEKPYTEPFTVSDVSFYPVVRREEAINILSGEYDCIIMDFGSNYKEHLEEFMRCDLKIAVGSLVPWKRYYLEEFLYETDGIQGSLEWIYAVNHTLEKEAALAARQLKRRLTVIPYGRDPFYLSPEAMTFTQNLL